MAYKNTQTGRILFNCFVVRVESNCTQTDVVITVCPPLVA